MNCQNLAKSCSFVWGVIRNEIEGVTKYIVLIFSVMVAALLLVSFTSAIPLLVPYLCGLVESMLFLYGRGGLLLRFQRKSGDPE